MKNSETGEGLLRTRISSQSFETGGRTVFIKVGGGFEILPGEIGANLRQ